MSLFNSFTSRPPTPPRDCEEPDVDRAIDHALAFLNAGLESLDQQSIPAATSQSSNASLETPEHTPSSSTETRPSARRLSSRRKKVNFAPFIQWDYHHSPIHPPTVVKLPVKPLAPSRERNPSRSILKPSKQPVLNSVAHRPYNSMKEMLDVTIDKLANGDLSTRLAAYSSSVTTLQNLDSFPDSQSLLEQSDAILAFIRRDMEWKPNSVPTQTHLVVAAIKLLVSFVRIPDVAASFSQEQISPILETSVACILAVDAPKMVLIHHLFFLSQQKLGCKIMTADRANRILTALTIIHDKIPGSGVRAYRMLIYRRFVEQCPAVMKARAGDWIVNLYTSMLSNKKEIREQAIDLGYILALRYGGSHDISRMIEELLDKEFDGKAFGVYAIERLQSLLEHKDISTPKIWAITVLFLRGRNKRETHWTWFKPWVQLASACVNSTDRHIKIETNLAWNRLIFATMPDMQMIPPVRNMLRAPIEVQLFKEHDFIKGVGRTAMSTYFCLLYYSLRPVATFEHLDLYWDEYVHQVLAKFVAKSPDNLYYACSILQSLFRLPTQWKENRANEQPILFDVEELPLLNPQWIRSRLGKILSLLVAFLGSRSSWLPIDDERMDSDSSNSEKNDSLGMATWTALMDVVREVGLKEVTTSIELKSAIAAIVNTFHQLAQPFRAYDKGNFHPSKAFGSLIESTLEKLGPAHFTEKMLLRSSTDAFEVAPTPSHRSNSNGSLISPITHIFILQLALASDRLPLSVHVDIIRSHIAQCWKALPLRTSRLDLLGNLAEALEALQTENAITQKELLPEMAELLLEFAEETVASDPSHIVSHPLGAPDISSLLRILKHVMPFLTTGRIPRVLYAHAVKGARYISNDGGVLLAVTEPQSATITDWMARDIPGLCEPLLTYATLIVDNDTRPRLGAVERARKVLWGGVSSFSDKHQDPDLAHINIWLLIDQALRYGYSHLDKSVSVVTAYANFIEAIRRHISRSLRSFNSLVRFAQKGFATVLLDESRKVKHSAKGLEGGTINASILGLWVDITEKYRAEFKTSNLAKKWLNDEEALVLAGLRSPRESIVNVTIAFWNDFVDLAKDQTLDIDYPDSVIEAAKRLRSIGDVHLPEPFADEEPPITGQTPVAFSDYGSQPSQISVVPRAFGSNRVHKFSPLPICKTQDMKSDTSVSKLTPKRKLRHEDSQIRFEPIPSSSPVQLETQNFTEHQKEVAERQRLNAASMFQDIKNDGQHESMSEPMIVDSDLVVASSDSEDSQSPAPSTPVIGPTHDVHDDEVPSSPITASVSRRQHRSSSSNPKSPKEPEILSSPPSPTLDAKACLQPTSIEEVEVIGTDSTAPNVKYDVFVEIKVARTEKVLTLAEYRADDAHLIENPEAEHAGLDTTETPENDGSDDFPSSQLVAELMASQSSTGSQLFLSVEKDEAATSPTNFTDIARDQSTGSIMRSLITADDLFPDGIPDTIGTDSYNAAIHPVGSIMPQYAQDSGKSKDSTLSHIEESQTPRRKRGRPRKVQLLDFQSLGSPLKSSFLSQDGLATPTESVSSVEYLSGENKVLDTSSNVVGLSSASQPLMRSSPGGRNPSSKLASCQVAESLKRPASPMEIPGSASETDRQASEAGHKRRKGGDGFVVPINAEALSTGNAVHGPETEADADADAGISFTGNRATPTPKSIMARLQSLITDARQMQWGRDERLALSDLYCDLQAATREVPVAAREDPKETAMDMS